MRVRALLSAALVLLVLPAAAHANYPHVVQSGETLTSVAATDGLSVAAIATANSISTQTELVAGQVLWIPPRTLTTASAGALATGTTGSSTTSTTGAAATDDTSVSAVAQTESDPDSDNDQDTSTDSTTGQASSTSQVATTSEVSTTSQPATTSSTASQSQTAYQNQQVTQGAGAYGVPVPTTERVSGSQIASIADANGVPAAFAEAIAWQESGWNNDEVSGAGAVGVMQIVPTTWTWIDRYLTPSDPLGTTSASENIRAGVLLLHQLLQLTGGNEQLAAAGYFQGLGSVEVRGMYASTRQYVSDVLALAQRL